MTGSRKVVALAAVGASMVACSVSEEVGTQVEQSTSAISLEDGRFTVLGHRGSRHTIEPDRYTQNSLAAFRRARDEGARGIELDVVWTGGTNRTNVVFHDREISGSVCQGSPSPDAVESLSLTQLRASCTLRNGERIMTLREMLSAVKPWITAAGSRFTTLMIELKDYGKDSDAIRAQTLSAIRDVSDYGLLANTIFISYDALANGIIGAMRSSGVIAGWDDPTGTGQQSQALAAPHLYYGSDWSNFAAGAIDVNAFSQAGKQVFAYTLNTPQYYNRLYESGARIVLTDDVATMERYRRRNPQRGANDVGVISDSGCPSGAEEVVVYTDDEDDNNENRHGGWIGAVTSEKNTTMRFCRVDGNRLHALARASSTASDFVVLKLGDSCPTGSVEFQRYLDNEDGDNENYALGDARPYVSDRNTLLSFCRFRGNPSSGYNALADLGFSYGVFAASSFGYGSASGFFYTDDEDDDNANWISSSDAVTLQIISDGRNTTFNVWRR